ncbi:phage integrase SAM-like domain and Arm DNA-binding domain-containing protein [Belliella sp. DSM 111904]|uniref:Phage integrase SAM-like domain and Arm DNA-binding domain-containing protein n=1 Tax=Belliella filtrata TaxID=2923435 RepID=A0ABS9V5F8_9BACT|nr:phage integrase SAM-like domain and Arm DNA-binding domain-containing protein [Belliella filtrata]MCH7411647.1 phage integrase SAM-like domain and Arm DNA-binding domain-containing protein [Belliella filtrata]
MIEKTFSILYYLKAARNLKGNQKHIYARITVDCVRVEISTKLSCDSDKWSSLANRAIGKSEKSKQVNAYLEAFSVKVYQARKYLMENDQEITAESIKNVLRGNTPDNRMVLEVFAEHNQQLEALVGKDFALGTLTRYKTSFDHTRSFIQWKYKTDDIAIKKLDYDFINDYSFWLKTVRGCSHNTTVKYLANFKKIVLNCVKKGWLSRDPFAGFKMTKKEIVRDYLSSDELTWLADKDFRIERLGQVRDVFLFSCYTGFGIT